MMLSRLLVAYIIFIVCVKANASFVPKLNYHASSRAMLQSPPIELNLTILAPPMYEDNGKLDIDSKDNDGQNKLQLLKNPELESDGLLEYEQAAIKKLPQEKGELKLVGDKIYQGENKSISSSYSMLQFPIKPNSEIMVPLFHENLSLKELSEELKKRTRLESVIISSSPIKLANGKIYQGEHRNGIPHGLGEMKFADGSQYQGAWENGMRHGSGNMKFANDDQFVGYWMRDKRHGKGRLICQNGGYYNGIWNNDYPLIDNMYYYGSFNKNGQAHGTGKIFRYHDYGYDCDGVLSYQGSWSNGKLIGKIIVTYCNGNVYYGYLNADKQYHGDGKLIRKDEDVVYTGFWFNNQLIPDLPVTIEYAKDNTRYQGTCVCSYDKGVINCLPHGYGKIFYNNGSYYEGNWDNGDCIRKCKIVRPNSEQYISTHDK